MAMLNDRRVLAAPVWGRTYLGNEKSPRVTELLPESLN